MGQLVLGLAGAGIGFALGGPAGAQFGWLLGSFAWNLLDPQKVQGPRLQDTTVRGGDYGVMVPILYGRARLGGVPNGQGSTSEGPNKFTEHSETSGGKGGPEITNYRYSLSWNDVICEGPIVGVARRWANGRLVTELGAAPGDPAWPYALYLGDTTQLPDPTMETIYGVGEVSPLRGIAHEVVTEYDVTETGNARPAVEYEAFTVGGDIPWRVSEFDPWPDLTHTLLASATYNSGVITTQITTGLTQTDVYVRSFNVDGTENASNSSHNVIADWRLIRGISNSLRMPMIYFTGIDYAWDANFSHPITAPEFSPTGILNNQMIYIAGYAFAVAGESGGATIIGKWALPDSGIPSAAPTDAVALDDVYTRSAVYLGNSDTGHLYISVADVGGNRLWKVDPSDMSIVHFWDTTDTAGTQFRGSDGNFFVYNNLVVTNVSLGGSTWGIGLVKIKADNSLENFGVTIEHTQGGMIYLGGGLGLDQDGVFSLVPPPGSAILGDIVTDLLQRAGLSPSQIDCSDLTQEVAGFVVGSQMTVRNAIDDLRKAYFFDLTEADGKVIGINRGHGAVATIPDEDLGAHEPSATSEAPELLEITHGDPSELPRTVFINYYDADRDYQQGTQQWARFTTLSKADVTLNLPLVLTGTEALQRAQWHMHFAWLELDHYRFATTRKWSKLIPTNVVVVRGVNIRITNKTEEPNGRIQFEGVRAFAGPYTSPITDPGNGPAPGGEVPGGEPGGQPPQEPPTGKADTGLILIDGPWINEADPASSLRVALYKDGGGSWGGASLYKSNDGGTTYASIGQASASAVVGTVQGTLGDYLGGNTVDESNVLTVDLVNGSLSSTTATGLLNGAYLVAVGNVTDGWEFLQYTTATLTSGMTYELTGLLRGRFGTERLIGTHAAGDLFVLISSTFVVPYANAELGSVRLFKAVTFGAAIADATAVSFTNTGVPLKAYAPVLLSTGVGASDEHFLACVPRRRGSGGWPNGSDLPATDPANYQFEIASDSGFATIVRVTGTTVPSLTYTAAQRASDLGASSTPYYWRVAQLCGVGLGYFAESTSP